MYEFSVGLGLDDLCARFIINLPREELESVERICFQVEEAQWFYEDFVRPLDPSLPSLNLRQFCLKIFQHCPLFSVYDVELHSKAFSEFLAYKTRVPVRGAILLNDALDEVVLVKGYKKGSSWSFPRGKINKDEKDIDCAIREVYEETGYDIRGAGLATDEEDVKSIDITMREQHIKLFVFPGVPKHTMFEPRTRKEISKIEWYKLSDLPTLKKLKQQQQQQQPNGQELAKNAKKFYMVAPFLVPLKKYITQLKKRNHGGFPYATQQQNSYASVHDAQDDHSSTPIVSTEAMFMNHDMTRLMAQLRQSQQASRENNFPEVTEPAISTEDASIQLKSLLNFPHVSGITARQDVRSAAERANKANAMLSLLRGNDMARSTESPMGTSYKRVIEQITEPLPRQIPIQERLPGQSQRSGLSPSHSQITSMQVQQYASRRTPTPGTMVQSLNLPIERPLQPSGLFHSQKEQSLPTQISSTPYKRDVDSELSQDPKLVDSRQNIGPPASKLPMPKLNAHSSALLNIFKGAVPNPPTSTEPVQYGTKQPSDRSELSASRPITGTQSQAPFTKPMLADIIGSTSALVPSMPSGTNKVSPRSTTQHQENLLNLFKSPGFTGKASPSLLSLPAAVELAANQPHTPLPAFPGQRQDIGVDSSLTSGIDSIGTKKPSKESVDLSKPRLSATVTGPLNVPQFESLRGPPASRQLCTAKKQAADAVYFEPQQPIRILTRPGSSHRPYPEPDGEPMKESERANSARQPQQRHKAKVPSRGSPKPFQPRILKRPVGAASTPERLVSQHSPRQPQPQKILARPSVLEERTPTTTFDQKAALLSLFGKSNTGDSFGARSSALPVSPLSERPGIDSGITSPAGDAKARIGSIQSLEDNGTGGGGRQTPRVVASSNDKKFLLNFLDGVTKEGRRRRQSSWT